MGLFHDAYKTKVLVELTAHIPSTHYVSVACKKFKELSEHNIFTQLSY